MKAEASRRLDVYTQGKQESDCRNNARMLNEGLPASESHTVKMRMAPVFDALPASPDVHKQRRIAASPPFLDRAVCDGAVRTFSEVDVPEVEGCSKRKSWRARVMLVWECCYNSLLWIWTGHF